MINYTELKNAKLYFKWGNQDFSNVLYRFPMEFKVWGEKLSEFEQKKDT